LTNYLSFALATLSAVFFIVDPLGLVPLFVAMTSHDAEAKRRRIALRATVVAWGVLSAFALFGSVIFRAFGITLSAFKVAGGILLLITAIDMLRAQPSRTRSSPEEALESTSKDDVAIVPLAMPLLAGPGAIATVTVLAGRGPTWPYVVPVLLSIALTCVAAYLLLRIAGRINGVLGRSGIAVLERIMGLLLAAIAVQFMADGARELLRAGG
jgi:multiple antibiotic resistance protein